MPAKNVGYARPGSTDITQRTNSGASTASRASSSVPDQAYATNPQFARLREQSTVSESDSKHGAHILEEFSSTAAASLQNYNSGFGAAGDSSMNGGGQIPFRYPSNSVPPNALYNAAPPSRPSSRQAQARAGTSTPQLGNGTDGEKDKKKGLSTTAANELELREMLDKNVGRPLESIAREVRNSERSQKAERAKQLYAMRW